MAYLYVWFCIPDKHYVYFDIVDLLVADITTKEELVVVQSL